MEKANLLNHELIVTIEKLVFGGLGLARLDALVIFVPFSAVGDVLKVRILNKKKNYAEAEIIEILQASKDRISPRCPHYGDCGGCNLQHISYEAQIRAKDLILKEWLEKLNRKLNWFSQSDMDSFYRPPEPSPLIFNYRNRIKLHVENGKLGFRKHKSHDLVAIKECYLPERELAESILPEILSSKAKKVQNGTCFLKLIPGGGKEVIWQESVKFASEKIKSPNGLDKTTIEAPLARDFDEEDPLSSPGFSQVNSRQNHFLQKKVLDFFANSTCSEVLDLYGGSGNFSFALMDSEHAPAIENILCVEASAQAIRQGRVILAGKELNFNSKGIAKYPRLRFIEAELEFFLKRYNNQKVPSGCSQAFVILDPPRSGASEEVMRALAFLKPKSLVYISCDPPSWARDMERFLNLSRTNGEISYKLEEILCVDMFPQTSHMEVVCYLSRCDRA